MTLKHRKWLCAILLLGGRIVQLVWCMPEFITVGAIFGEDRAERSAENAFKYALYRVNHDRRVKSPVKVKFKLHHSVPFDTFRASKKVCNMVKEGAKAFFGPQNLHISSFLNSLSNTLKIPHIEVRQDGHANKNGDTFAINIHPDPNQLGLAYADVIRHFRWKSVLVLYDDRDSLLRIQSVIRAPLARTDVTIRQVDHRNIRAVLTEAKNKGLKDILADLDLEHTKLLLKIALQMGMIDSYHSFIIANLDIETIDLEDYIYNHVNFTAFRLVNPDNPNTRNILDDMEIYELQTDLKILNKSRTIKHKSALMFDGVMLFIKALQDLEKTTTVRLANLTCDSSAHWSDGETLLSHMNQATIDGLTGRVSLNNGRRMEFSLDVLTLNSSGLRVIGNWTSSHRLRYGGTDRRATMAHYVNKTFNVTSIIEAPYLMYKADYKKYKGNDMFEGFCVDLLEKIAAKVGFKYNIRLVQDKKYGALGNDGKWNGMVGELINRKADMSMAPLTISYPREQVIDFTKPFLNLGISILFKIPTPESPGLFSFLNPLAIEIWLYVIGSYILVSVAIFVLARFSPYEWYNPHPCNIDTDTIENDFSMCNSLWFTVGTLMQQGSDINPRAVSTRIVGGIWWFFTLIIIASYTANLAAFLTVERMVSPIENAEDLAKQTKISYGTLEGGSTMTFFKMSTIETYRRMWEFMRKTPSVFTSSNMEGVERVLRGNYAFLIESTMLEYMLSKNCSLMQVGGMLDSKGYGIGTPVNSPYRDQLSLAILELQEAGTVMALYDRWWKSSNSCPSDGGKDTKASSLGMANVGGIFVVLLGGLALAVFVALAEFTWNSKRNATHDRQPLCTEMAEELRFAVQCHGASQKMKAKHRRRSSIMRQTHRRSETYNVESPNGTLQVRNITHSPRGARRVSRCSSECDYHFKQDLNRDYRDFLRVDYSDNET